MTSWSSACDETLNDALIDVFIFRIVPMYVIIHQHVLKCRVDKFNALVGLQHSRSLLVGGCEYFMKCFSHLPASFATQWYRPGSFGKDVNAGQQ